MRLLGILSMYIALIYGSVIYGQPKHYAIHTVAFYNLENLFDTIANPATNDQEWTPEGKKHWNSQKYRQKLANLSSVILDIGSLENKNAPTLLGCCEIENRTVLEDLIHQPLLQHLDYGIIHFDSPDKRGIDVALMYQKKFFRPTSYANIPLYIYKNQPKTDPISPKRVFTRDQLLISGFLEDEPIHIIVNHWPSRSGGQKRSSPYREAAGRLNRKIIDSLQHLNPHAKIITLGDLNDGPTNQSIKKGVGASGNKQHTAAQGIYNPFENMAKRGLGTIAYRDSWDIFDQIMLSEPFINQNYSGYQYWKAGIYNKPFLVQQTGKYKGYPKRNSAGQVGYSDHFPVYLYLIKQIH
ncbi:endonuclease [Flavobacterium crassostreae]|uniref:Endonuclease n=1 Tax=Flavobacterium crassostreae TaxID=1763534 RepID=A0A1B9E660_9FLAO|nr:endonuclease [Flavobacterium crassostreae]OCB77411.1 endonuclease [Flavobacterium crassostreae]